MKRRLNSWNYDYNLKWLWNHPGMFEPRHAHLYADFISAWSNLGSVMCLVVYSEPVAVPPTYGAGQTTNGQKRDKG